VIDVAQNGASSTLATRARSCAKSGRWPPPGTAWLFTTHDPNQALRLADRAFLLRAGTRVTDGPVSSALTKQNLEALYGAPVRVLTDAATGDAAFLPG
jgi:iron complex transport system ATP-binding protein